MLCRPIAQWLQHELRARAGRLLNGVHLLRPVLAFAVTGRPSKSCSQEKSGTPCWATGQVLARAQVASSGHKEAQGQMTRPVFSPSPRRRKKKARLPARSTGEGISTTQRQTSSPPALCQVPPCSSFRRSSCRSLGCLPGLLLLKSPRRPERRTHAVAGLDRIHRLHRDRRHLLHILELHSLLRRAQALRALAALLSFTARRGCTQPTWSPSFWRRRGAAPSRSSSPTSPKSQSAASPRSRSERLPSGARPSSRLCRRARPMTSRRLNPPRPHPPWRRRRGAQRPSERTPHETCGPCWLK